MLICYLSKCPYNEKNRCAKPLKIMTVNGTCAFIWDDEGRQKPTVKIKDSFKTDSRELEEKETIEVIDL